MNFNNPKPLLSSTNTYPEFEGNPVNLYVRKP